MKRSKEFNLAFARGYIQARRQSSGLRRSNDVEEVPDLLVAEKEEKAKRAEDNRIKLARRRNVNGGQ